jgi:conjugative relaxase-like TrwC/TraI family protein
VQETIDKRVAAELGELARAMPDQVRKIRLEERAKNRTRTPYYDMTFSAEKSVSLAYAGLRAAAKAARDEGREQDAEQLEARARSVEAAVMAGADAMIGHVEQRGAIIRTGHHSAGTGEFRDAAGFVAAKFLQHTSRSGDPQLHVQVPLLNRAQRADRTDERWRALDGRPLWAERLGAAAYAGLAEAQELARLGFPLVKRADGNGFEIGGIEQSTMDAFSARSADIAARLAERITEYQQMFGHPPNRQALFKLRKRVTVETRAAKRKPAAAEPEEAGARAREAEAELAAWVRRASDKQVQGLACLGEAVEAYAAEHPEARPAGLPAARARGEIMRAAVAEVQRQNAAWTRAKLEWELYRQLPVLPRWADWGRYLSDMADDILGGRAEGVNVLQIAPVPDVVDVSRLGFRKDGTSIYRPPGEARYVTAEHLDLEEWLLSTSTAGVPQRITIEAADGALAGTGLDLDQRAAARGLLASQRAVAVLVAPAGTGKTFTMAQFARAWTAQTGRRVIGLTMAENAARVMAGEGMSEAWNIARFFARGVPVHDGDVLVVDEASQVSTADLARIVNLARRAGARVILAGDTEQLGPVEAGGMFRLIAAEGERHALAEVRRFTHGWERQASLQLRAGDLAAWAGYGTHGRVEEGPRDRVHDRAVDWWLTDIAQGKTSLLLAASNEEAARLAGIARERRIERGQIPGGRDITLSDGNPAGRGDLVRARLNAEIDAAGQPLANRDVLRITGWQDDGAGREAIAQRQLTGPGADGRRWSDEFTVPAAYLQEHAELAYAGNVYVAQGRTVDTAHLVVSEGMTRDLLYVGMTRGRESNHAHVVTGPPDPADMSRQERYAFTRAAIQRAGELLDRGDTDAALAVEVTPPEPEGMRDRAPWEAVIAAAMERDEPLGTAIEAMRQAVGFPVNLRHLYELKQAFWWKDVVPQIDEMVRQRIGKHAWQLYLTDPERPAFLQELRRHELGGRAIPDVLDAITAAPLDGARSVAAVLHGRAGKEPAPARGETTTWADRTPARATPEILEVDTTAVRRQAGLGEQLAADPPPWAVEAWGQPPTEPGALREDWKQRAALVQSYRELAGITDPAQAIGPAPARQAELAEAFAAAVRALELADDAALLKAMGRGELEARVREYDRAEAVAPPDVSADIDHNDGARTYTLDQAKREREARNSKLAASAAALAGVIAAEGDRLRVAQAARQEWAEANAAKAEAAAQARAELSMRGPARRDEGGAGPGGAEVRQAAAVDAAQAERWHRAQAGQATGIRALNRTFAPGPQAEDIRRADPARWAEIRAAQTASVEAGKAARREASARAVPVTDAEIAKYGGELAALDPEAIAVIASIQGHLAAARAGADQLAEKRARDRAEIEQAGIDEPVNHAETQASMEAAAAADQTNNAEADNGPGLEI